MFISKTIYVIIQIKFIMNFILFKIINGVIVEYENLKTVFEVFNRLVKKIREDKRLYVIYAKDEYFALILLLLCCEKKINGRFEIDDCILIIEPSFGVDYIKAIVTGKEIRENQLWIKYKMQDLKKIKKNGVVEFLKPESYMEKNAVVVSNVDKNNWLSSRITKDKDFNDLYKVNMPVVIGNSLFSEINKLKERLQDYPEFDNLQIFIQKLYSSKNLNIFSRKEMFEGSGDIYINNIPLDFNGTKIIIFSVFNYNYEYNSFLLNEYLRRNYLKLNEEECGWYVNSMVGVKVYEG